MFAIKNYEGPEARDLDRLLKFIVACYIEVYFAAIAVADRWCSCMKMLFSKVCAGFFAAAIFYFIAARSSIANC